MHIYNREDQEDVYQEIASKLYKNFKQFEMRCTLSSWIGRITINACNTWLEKKTNERRRRAIDRAEDTPTKKGKLSQQDPNLAMKLHYLMKNDLHILGYIIIALYYGEGLKLKEIGEIIGLSTSRVSVIKSTALMTLKDSIGDSPLF